MSAVVRVVRSGRTEALHHASIAVVDRNGTIVAATGDVTTPFHARSSLKPFQAQVSQRFGSNLMGKALAIACSSHAGLPEQLRIVQRILDEAGLDEADLRVPVDWPSSPRGRDEAVLSGAREPRRIFHNCSGKHSAMLRACRASDLPIDTYLSPGHPLQAAIGEEVRGITEEDFGPPGVDGCGAPVFALTVVGLARAFAGLATDPGRTEVHDAMRDHPGLIGEPGRVDGVVATALGGAAKGGAEGCLGIAVSSGGLGIGIKIWDGSERALRPMVAATLDRLDLLTPELETALEVVVSGGGRTVGWLEADVEWEL